DPDLHKLVQVLADAAQRSLEQAPLLEDLVPETKAVTPRRKSGVVVAPAAKAEASAEAIFAAATAGAEGGPSPSRPPAPQSRKRGPWLYAAGGLGVAAVGAVAAFLLLPGREPLATRPEVAAANSTTPDTSKAPPMVDPKPPDIEPTPKIDPV